MADQNSELHKRLLGNERYWFPTVYFIVREYFIFVLPSTEWTKNQLNFSHAGSKLDYIFIVRKQLPAFSLDLILIYYPTLQDTLKVRFYLVLPQPQSLYCLEIKPDKLQYHGVG